MEVKILTRCQRKISGVNQHQNTWLLNVPSLLMPGHIISMASLLRLGGVAGVTDDMQNDNEGNGTKNGMPIDLLVVRPHTNRKLRTPKPPRA